MTIKTALQSMNLQFYVVLLFSFFVSKGLYSQTSNISQGCVPLAVNFTSPAGSTTYYWDFQDGASSSLQNPSNTFITAGTYNVEFKNTPTGPVVGTVTINVFDKPVPTITANTVTQGCLPLPVNFTANVSLPGGISVSNYTWTYGEGSSGNGQNVNFIYNTQGTFGVSIGIVTNAPSCNNTVTYPNSVGVSNPFVNFTTNPNPAVSCTAPLNGVVFTNTTFNNGIPMTYAWDMGNGNTSTSLNPPNQDYTTLGSYTVSLTIIDTNGCVKSTTKPVSLGGPVASFTAPDTICINDVFQFFNTSTAGFPQWTFGPNASIQSTSIQSNPFNGFNTVGPQTVTLTINAPGGCSDAITKIIFVEDPTVTVSSAPFPQCDTNFSISYSANTTANIVNYEWVFFLADDAQDTMYVANPTVDYHIWDSTYYKRRLNHQIPGFLVYTTSGGCKDTVFFSDTLDWVFGRFMPDKHYGCAPLTIDFSDSSLSNYPITSYGYDYGDGTTATFTSAGAVNSHTYNLPGVYPVVLTVSNNIGCTNISDTIWIEVGDLVPLDFSVSPSVICPGESVTMTNLTVDPTNIDAWHYSSSGELLSDCFQNANGTFVFDDSVGVFSVTLTGIYNGCVSTHTIPNAVTVNGPIAGFDWFYDCSDTMDMQFTNQSQGYTSHLWDFGDGTTSTQVSPLHTYTNTGDYYVTLTATNNASGCPISVDSTLIHIKKIQADMNVPSIICGNDPTPYSAAGSIDVEEQCNRGYHWIFSDPTVRPISTSNPDENFFLFNSGPQTVTLVVTDINGCTDTSSTNVEVFNVTAGASLVDNSICAPTTIQMADLSVADAALDTWSWNIPLYDTILNGQNPSVVIDSVASDTVYVFLTATDIHGCQSFDTTYFTIYDLTSNVSMSPSSGHLCVGQNIQFSASDFTSQGSNLNFVWNFGDGGTSTSQNPTYSYSSDTTVQVSVIFTEAASGCVDTTVLNVDVQSFPIADYITNVDLLPALCDPTQIDFTSQSSGTSPVTSNAWTFSNGLSSSSPTPSFVFNAGTYTAQLIVQTSYGCMDTIIKTFDIIGPAGDFTMDTNYICLGDPIQFTLIDTNQVGGYSWDFGDGSSDVDQSPISHNYNFIPPSGQTVAKLTVYGAGGACPITVEKPVFIREVIADFERNGEVDTTLCLGEQIIITNTSLNTDVYNWNFGNGNVSASAGPTFAENYTYADTFLIYLDVYNIQYGCRDTMIKEIIVFNRPSFVAFDDTVCLGEIGYLTVDTTAINQIYTWTPTTGLSNPNIPNPTATLTSTADYQLTVLDTISDCSLSDSASVNVIQPLADIIWDTTVVVGDSATLPINNQNGFINFIWTPNVGLSCYGCSNPTHQGLEEITYTVVMEDILGCSQANGTFLIKIYPDTHIDLPTTFTPNGDGVNDIIYLKGWGIKEVIYFQIYNRWGELVFESNDIDYGWDGYYKGVLQNNDTYTYKATVKTWRDKTIESAGFINLMR
jgi:gliding motility-associated-like protein